jgi:transposase
MPDGTFEIITGRERRRRWSTEAKLRIVAESLEPGACVKSVAARHDVYPSLVFSWRRQVREGQLAPPASPSFVPVRLRGLFDQGDTQAPPASAAGESSAGDITITLPDGTHLHISHAAQLPLLRGVLGVLRG